MEPENAVRAVLCKEPVQLVDVMPTVLDLIGAKPPDMIEGQSLVPLIQGQPFRRRIPAMASPNRHLNARPDDFVPENRIDTFAVLEPDWKLIYREKRQEAGLHHVEPYIGGKTGPRPPTWRMRTRQKWSA